MEQDALVQEVVGVSHNGRLVITGGEPMLQVTRSLLSSLRKAGIEYITIETNGLVPIPPDVRENLDWITVSPKCPPKHLQVTRGNELKVLYPDFYEAYMLLTDTLQFDHYFLQPIDGPYWSQNIKGAVQTVMQYPRWRVSLQTHKFYGCDPPAPEEVLEGEPRIVPLKVIQ